MKSEQYKKEAGPTLEIFLNTLRYFLYAKFLCPACS